MGRRARYFTDAERRVAKLASDQTPRAKERRKVHRYVTYWKTHGRRGSATSPLLNPPYTSHQPQSDSHGIAELRPDNLHQLQSDSHPITELPPARLGVLLLKNHDTKKGQIADTQTLVVRVNHLMATLNDTIEVSRRRGTEVQTLLNEIQELLDQPLESRVRSKFVGELVKLSRRSGLYPQCLVRRDIRTIGEHAVAAGHFGDVWKGLMGDRNEVAVKVLKVYGDSDFEKLLKSFSCEAVIWRQLSHPNILPFHGMCHLNNQRTRVCLISPWMSNGHVGQFLVQFPDADRVNLVLDIARGLEYLHNMKPCIVHGDLKSVNIFITSDRRACLADFGLAAVRDSLTPMFSSMSSDRLGGSLRWMAPELLPSGLNDGRSQGRTCPATDVYAFACICYEIFSGNIPFQEIRKDIWVMFAIVNGKRPTRPSQELCQTRGLNDELWSIIEECWTTSPTERPTASQIVESWHLKGRRQ